jgi:hypothetical protein
MGQYFDTSVRPRGSRGIAPLVELVSGLLSIGEQVEGFRGRREDRERLRALGDADEARRTAAERRATEDQDRELADAGYQRTDDAIGDVDQRRGVGLSPFRNRGERDIGRTVGQLLSNAASPEELREIAPFRRKGAPSVVRTGKSRQEERDAATATARAELARELEQMRGERDRATEGTWQREITPDGRVVYFNPVTREMRETPFAGDRTPDDGSSGTTPEERARDKANKGLEFQQTRFDRLMQRRPTPSLLEPEGSPEFASRRAPFVTDSTRVAGDLERAERGVDRAYGVPAPAKGAAAPAPVERPDARSMKLPQLTAEHLDAARRDPEYRRYLEGLGYNLSSLR